MSSLYTQLVSKLLFPLQERLKGHSSVAQRRALEHSQWLSSEQIQQLQSDKLQTFLQRIYNHVPYYQRLFDSLGVDVHDIDSPTKLSQLPFLTKAIIRDNEDSLKADNAQGLTPFNTGGSSGSPLIFFLNNERVSHDVAAKWRATRWWGVDIGDPEIVAWGSPIELNGQDRIKLLRDRLMRSQLLSAFDMNETHIQNFIHCIQNTQPRMLFGYPSVYDLLAQRAEAQGVRLDNLGIKVAFVTSEKLYDHQRERIERVFGCPVANGYGGRDAGFIAHECPEGGMHISAEDIIVEIIDSEGNPLPLGQSGEIVVTNMATSAFPFIRYRTGDIGTISHHNCSCGRGLPLLEEIEGRTTDFVVAQDGTIMHGLALIYVLRGIPGIKAFKITQESVDNTLVEVAVEDSPLNNDIRQTIIAGIRQRLGLTVKVGVKEVDKILPERSGKYRYVKSNIPPNAA